MKSWIHGQLMPTFVATVIAMAAAQPASAGNGGGKGNDPKMAFKEALRQRIEGEGQDLKRWVTDYLTQRKYDELTNVNVKAKIDAMVRAGLIKDLQATQYYASNICSVRKDPFSSSDAEEFVTVGASTRSERRAPVCFNIAKATEDFYPKLEVAIFQLASWAIHEAAHQFEEDTPELLEQNEQTARFVGAAVLNQFISAETPPAPPATAAPQAFETLEEAKDALKKPVLQSVTVTATLDQNAPTRAERQRLAQERLVESIKKWPCISKREFKLIKDSISTVKKAKGRHTVFPFNWIEPEASYMNSDLDPKIQQALWMNQTVFGADHPFTEYMASIGTVCETYVVRYNNHDGEGPLGDGRSISCISSALSALESVAEAKRCENR